MNSRLLAAKLLGSVTLALLPIAAHLLPSGLGSGVLFDSTATFVGAHVACGLMAGMAFGFLALPAAPVAYAVSMVYLTQSGFVGGGGDGDLFYVVALFGALAFFAASVGGAVTRLFLLPRMRAASGS